MNHVAEVAMTRRVSEYKGINMPVLSLLRQGNPLANAERQREVLERDDRSSIPSFQSTLTDNGFVPLKSGQL